MLPGGVSLEDLRACHLPQRDVNPDLPDCRTWASGRFCPASSCPARVSGILRGKASAGYGQRSRCCPPRGLQLRDSRSRSVVSEKQLSVSVVTILRNAYLVFVRLWHGAPKILRISWAGSSEASVSCA